MMTMFIPKECLIYQFWVYPDLERLLFPNFRNSFLNFYVSDKLTMS